MKKILVAMSGGVDSSVAAALLKKKGYDVTGVFMHFWHEKNKSNKSSNKCCSVEAQEAARKVCQKLDMRLYTINCKKSFKKNVVDYFVNTYESGLTPNPCVECNKHIKFKFLLNKANELNADYLATGHYARIKNNLLYRAKDKSKDQSYFLYNLNQKQLAKIKFPIGEYKKEEVRKLAKKFGLPTAQRPESQEVCFVPEKNHNDFLKRHLKKLKSGKILDSNDQEVGEHKGLPLYTLGQRRGIGVAHKNPYYVTDLNFGRNILRVSDDPQDSKIYTKKLSIKKMNLIGDMPLPHSCKIKIRHCHQAQDAKIEKINNTSLLASFKIPQRAIMPGQSAVIYVNDRVIGGGVIAKDR